MPTNVGLDTQNALAGLGKWRLERDDSQADFPHRVYRNNEGEVFASVTHILGETAPQHQKDALERWQERPTSGVEREVAATRGTLAHNHAEYLLKTAAKLGRQSANKKGVYRTSADGLERMPSKICSWAIQKAISSAPRVSWSAAGYARGLRSWIEGNITNIHAVEFSIQYVPTENEAIAGLNGWAGTCDCLADVCSLGSDISEGPILIDWKTSQNKRSDELYVSYYDQLGAYSLGLTQNTGLKARGGLVVCARRSGAPDVKYLDQQDLFLAETRFMQRFRDFRKQLGNKKAPSV